MGSLLKPGYSFERVDAAYLDCVADNLAVLLCHLGVADVRTPFACQWYFAFDLALHGDLPILAKKPITDIIRQQTGCAVQQHRFDSNRYIEALETSINHNSPVMILGDAYHMPWLPYFGKEHMKHSFIIDGFNENKTLLHIVDAYFNRTEWGDATPTETTLPIRELVRVIEELDDPDSGSFFTMQREEPQPTIDISSLLLQNAEHILAQVRDKASIHNFSEYYARHSTNSAVMKQFVLACWLAARSRALHQLWLADIARERPQLLESLFTEQFSRNISKPWQRVGEFAYILSRRVSQGKRPPDMCFRLLEQVIAPNEIQAATSLLRLLPGSSEGMGG